MFRQTLGPEFEEGQENAALGRTVTRKGSMALYQILSWQEIPSQIKAWDEFDEVKLELGLRATEKIDAAAQARGLSKTDDYLAQWNWSDEAEREGTAREVAEALKKELEAKLNSKS